MSQFHIHLVSDSTGETVSSVARAALAQFEGVHAREHVWPLVRTQRQVDKVIDGIREYPGAVLMTLVEREHRHALRRICAEIGVPCVHILSGVLAELGAYLGQEVATEPGRQHKLDEDYFSRVEAINFALSHDDGQMHWNLEEADIVLVGVSRSSKSPTCMYLAFRGYKAANVPFVPGCELPGELETLKTPLIVGLTVNVERLVQIRRNRLVSLHDKDEGEYTDDYLVKQEVTEARKYFTRRGWPTIDVTRRSVEETAAHIIKLLKEKRNKGT